MATSGFEKQNLLVVTDEVQDVLLELQQHHPVPAIDKGLFSVPHNLRFNRRNGSPVARYEESFDEERDP